jgi:hypothetical protein
MFKKLQEIIPGFDFDSKNLKNKKILIEDSNSCTGEWLVYSLIEHFIRSEDENNQT